MKMTEHFGMKMNPFAKGGTKAKDAFLSEDHKKMQDRLKYLVKAGGLGVFTAPPGMGKTYALHSFACQLNPNKYTTTYVNLTTVGLTEFYAVICEAVGLETNGRRSALFSRLHKYITQLHDNSHKPLILMVDEAQHLHPTVLNDLKLLMNHDYDSRNCFTLILLGEPILLGKLNAAALESLRQRITVHYSYMGMSPEETRQYVEYKLKLAGASTDIVCPGITAILHSLSNGNPREMDRLMTQALILAAHQDKAAVDAEDLRAAKKTLTL